MSLKIGGSKSKTKTQSQSHEQSQSRGWTQQQSQDWSDARSRAATFNNSQSNSTRTALAPEWASSLTQGVAGRVASLNALDPSNLIAPAHGLQTLAASRAGQLGAGGANFDAAADIARGVAQGSWLDARMASPGAQIGAGGSIDGDFSVDAPAGLRGESLLDNLSAYMSPYTHDVVDSTLADFDVDAGHTRAQQDLDLAGAGAFGGSGAALTRSMTEGELSRARANAAATLRDQAFQRGASLSSEDAGRRQQAQMLNAQLAFQRSGQNAQLGQERAIQNAQLAQERAIQNAQLQQQDWAARTNALLAGQDQRLRAGESLANLTSAYDQNARANIATQAELGGALRDIDQQQRQAPVTSAQQVVAMLSGLPIGLFTGEQTSSNQSSQQVSDTASAEAKGSSSSSTNATSSVADGTASGTSKTKSSDFSASLNAEDAVKRMLGLN